MVIVRRNLTTEYGLTTVVVPFTDAEGKPMSVIRPLIIAAPGSGLIKDCLAACDQIRCVDRLRLINKVGKLNGSDFALILRGLYEILDFGGSY